ncbi:MAG: hypothetical protein WCI18_04570 [Pseudomonadota bacterium]
MTVASSPGKIMLSGEYAVLNGGRALAHTLNKRLAVEVLQSTKETSIISDLWAKKKYYREDDPDFICQSLKYFESVFGKLPPLEIKINSDIEINYGIGSSSALRLSLFAALQKHLNLDCSMLDIAQLAYKDQKRAQGQASGYDTLTQALGGLVEMTIDEDIWPKSSKQTKSCHLERIQMLVGGKGAPTRETLESVSQWLTSNRDSHSLQAVSEDLTDAWLGSDFPILLEKIEAHRLFFDGAPRFPRELSQALKPHQNLSQWSWKLTGAGGEDALIVVGNIPTEARLVFQNFGWRRADFTFSGEGLKYGL